MEIAKRYIDGRWGQVHLRETGVHQVAGVPLLLIHQSPVSGLMFEAAMPLLAMRGFHVVAPDTAGYGNSDPAPEGTGIVDHGEALGVLLDALGWESCHLLGHHTGAAIAAAFAARHRIRVRKLVLNGVPLFSTEELEHFRSFRFAPLMPRADGSHLLDAWNQRLRASPGWSDLAAMHRYVVEMLRVNETYHLGFTAALAHDMRADLAALDVPTMVLTNTGEDLYQASRRAAQIRDDFACHELRGGTHDIVDEQPHAWTGAVADFLLRETGATGSR